MENVCVNKRQFFAIQFVESLSTSGSGGPRPVQQICFRFSSSSFGGKALMAEGGERKGEEEEISSYENFPIPPPPFLSLFPERTSLRENSLHRPLTRRKR